jgi:hypothetical protein
MKTQNLKKSFLAVAAVTGLVLSAMTVAAQDSSNATVSQTAPQAAPVQLSYGVSQIVQLAQAKVSDSTILTFVQNSGNSYGLDANQIIYLRQNGVSDAVVSAMLNQPKNVAASQPAPQPSSTQNATVVQPATTYVQSTPASSVYVIPDTQTYYYDSYYQPAYYPYYGPYYGWGYPAVSLSFGFGGHWGGGYHGGGWGGYHGGGGFHGGGHR